MTLLQSRLLAVVDFLLEAQEQIARARVKYLARHKLIARKESIYLHDYTKSARNIRPSLT